MNMNETPSLIRADVGSSNHWLKVKLIGTVSNRGEVARSAGSRLQAQVPEPERLPFGE